MGPSSEARFANLSGAILAGGASRRMGRPKAQLPVGGLAAATRVARALAAVTSDILQVGGEPSGEVGRRHVPDLAGPPCALRGLVSALEACTRDRLLVVATDLVLIEPALLLALVAWPEADAVVACPEEGPQPLCALYRREPALDAARERLADGRLGLRALLEQLDTRWLRGADLAAVDPRGHALLNVNTPEDLQRAESWAEADAWPVRRGPG